MAVRLKYYRNIWRNIKRNLNPHLVEPFRCLFYIEKEGELNLPCLKLVVLDIFKTFLQKVVLFFKTVVWELCERLKQCYSCFQFFSNKRPLLVKKNLDNVFGIRLSDCSKSAANYKVNIAVMICQHDMICQHEMLCFWLCCISLALFRE